MKHDDLDELGIAQRRARMDAAVRPLGGEWVRDCVYRINGQLYDLSATNLDALPELLAAGSVPVEWESLPLTSERYRYRQVAGVVDLHWWNPHTAQWEDYSRELQRGRLPYIASIIQSRARDYAAQRIISAAQRVVAEAQGLIFLQGQLPENSVGKRVCDDLRSAISAFESAAQSFNKEAP